VDSSLEVNNDHMTFSKVNIIYNHNSLTSEHYRFDFIINRHFQFHKYKRDRLCDLVVGVPGYRTEMYCVSCEVRTEFINVM
jgi:hypothetical protein